MVHSVRLFCFSPQYIAYDAAFDWQRKTAARLRAGASSEALALLEHEPVFTFGRRVRPHHLLASRAGLAARGAAVVETDRGGDITFHGPGQVVCYPVLDLRQRGVGAVDYVRRLETTVIETLGAFGIEGARVEGRPGVWVEGAKVAAIGVRVQGGVCTHGFALNVETDLSWFDAIVPCGIPDAPVTSMARILGRSPGIAAVADAICDSFEALFDSTLVACELEDERSEVSFREGPGCRVSPQFPSSIRRSEADRQGCEAVNDSQQVGRAPTAASAACEKGPAVAHGR
jgi:lipoate-protein ligase B